MQINLQHNIDELGVKPKSDEYVFKKDTIKQFITLPIPNTAFKGQFNGLLYRLQSFKENKVLSVDGCDLEDLEVMHELKRLPLETSHTFLWRGISWGNIKDKYKQGDQEDTAHFLGSMMRSKYHHQPRDLSELMWFYL